MADGLVGEAYEIQIAHTSWVGDNRPHDDDPDKCWCWAEYEALVGKKEDNDA